MPAKKSSKSSHQPDARRVAAAKALIIAVVIALGIAGVMWASSNDSQSDITTEYSRVHIPSSLHLREVQNMPNVQVAGSADSPWRRYIYTTQASPSQVRNELAAAFKQAGYLVDKQYDHTNTELISAESSHLRIAAHYSQPQNGGPQVEVMAEEIH